MASENPEISQTYVILGESLQKLDKSSVELIQNYIVSNSRPRIPNAEEEAKL